MVIIINSIIELLTTKIPLGNWVENLVNFLINNFSGPLNNFSSFIEFIVNGIESILAFPHPLVLIAIFAVAAWKLKGKNMAIFVALGLSLVLNLGMWEPLVITLASIITSVLIALFIGIPIGIIKAHNKVVDLITRPILDFMQTIPPFVYLIPALMFFGLGNVSGVIATVVFAIAPPIRLTYLGIKQVDEELEEAGHAFGANWWQILLKIELPGAMPSIMMGINQCIMLSLSMVVIAAMIGAGGLGKPVLRSLNVVDIGLGFEAGLGVVIIAMVLDRMFGRDS
ncbi:glycine betaine/proline transport system permease protein [Halanaerobium saccharolyticum]|uniref:Glycine betaine/proline transport system permease protein n=1 Tax=Halanaerobium saccharolyticum TaxID=43595 RepID=A0A4R7YRD6_9FIRM|nr:proline/glycine betaine ABC transporter permease [Halanaerobium saccharolyticum]RAK05253.1 glycine betaine/proline transport system permease protein [Halanaerobium saccharolyticum]TDV99618.1 glycine betaine/proline transport system permease protein [Halanaerobium saccharolyticum]TDX51734.1 glycine betaine/proline transport system permease protein [Halanaerobium saccharolyticum]